MAKSKLAQSQIDQITASVLKINERQKKKERKEKRDWQLHNTKLLLQNYRMLKAHCKDIPLELTELENNTVFDIEDLTLVTLMEHKAKSYKLLQYFDATLQAYNNLCYASEEADKRRYRAIHYMYLSEKIQSKPTVAKALHVDRKTIERDVQKATNDLSIMLFGVDAVLEK